MGVVLGLLTVAVWLWVRHRRLLADRERLRVFMAVMRALHESELGDTDE